MKVYLVEQGEAHEGGSCIYVADSKEKAIEFAENYIAESFKGMQHNSETLTWYNGLDYVCIQEMKVN